MVLEAGPDGAFANRNIEGLVRCNDPNASPQISSIVQAHKGAAMLAQSFRRFRDFGDLRKIQVSHQGLPRDAQ